MLQKYHPAIRHIFQGRIREIIPLFPAPPICLRPNFALLCYIHPHHHIRPWWHLVPCSRVNTRTSTTRPGTLRNCHAHPGLFAKKSPAAAFFWRLVRFPSGDATPEYHWTPPGSDSNRIHLGSEGIFPTFGISRVISSGPSFVCLASLSYFRCGLR